MPNSLCHCCSCLVLLDHSSIGKINWKCFLKICLYSMFIYLVYFSRRKFQKLRKVVFSSFDCESVECSLVLLSKHSEIIVTCLDIGQSGSQDFDFGWRIFRHIHWMYPRRFIPEMCICREECLICSVIGMYCASWESIWLLHGCVSLKSNARAWSRWFQILFAAGKGLKADIVGSPPYPPCSYLRLFFFPSVCGSRM